MSTLSSIENLIGIEVRKEVAPGKDQWSQESSQKLAADIAAKVDPLKLNIRCIQDGDNLFRIVEGLSRHTLKLKVEEGDGRIESLPVTYLGDSRQIEEERTGNPQQLLRFAGLIKAGQFAALNRDHSRVFIADAIEHILDIIH